jgi:hypothetical protein
LVPGYEVVKGLPCLLGPGIPLLVDTLNIGVAITPTEAEFAILVGVAVVQEGT